MLRESLTFAPLTARACVIIRPMPVPPPVTRATRPFKLKRLLRLKSPWLAAATLWVAIVDVCILGIKGMVRNRQVDVEVCEGFVCGLFDGKRDLGLRNGVAEVKKRGDAWDRPLIYGLALRRGRRAVDEVVEGIMTLSMHQNIQEELILFLFYTQYGLN